MGRTYTETDDQELYDILLDAEAHALAWVNRPASAPASFRGVPVRVLPHALYQSVDVAGLERPSLVVTANGLCFCCLKGNQRIIWPRLYSNKLREAVVHAVLHCAYDVLQLSEVAAVAGQLGDAGSTSRSRSTVEIAGDILCDGAASEDGSWEVFTVICENRHATNISSVPSCAKTRSCSNDDPRRERGTLVGEFHSHPEHDPRHIKPLSEYDLYQLTVAAANGVHSCSAVIAYDGLHFCAASGRALRHMLPDIYEYYRIHGYGPAECRRSLQQCRQPIAEKVPPDLRCLHWLLRVLRGQYMDLMASAHKSSQTELARRFYKEFIGHYGYSALFITWSKHPRQWRAAADAKMGREVVSMMTGAAGP